MKKSDIVAFGAAALVAVITCYLLSDKGNEPEASQPRANEAPVPKKVQNPFDYVVRVTAHGREVSHVGVGTLVTYDEYTFVLTSKMVFRPGDMHYTVTVDDEQLSAMLLRKSEWLGLAALAVANREFVGMRVDEAPNIPPDASVLVWGLGRSFDANVVQYTTNPDWLLLDGNLPNTCTGSPITTFDNSLAGVIIGVNTENSAEAFAVGNHAIRAFADLVVHGTPRSANPNLLPQGF